MESSDTDMEEEVKNVPVLNFRRSAQRKIYIVIEVIEANWKRETLKWRLWHLLPSRQTRIRGAGLQPTANGPFKPANVDSQTTLAQRLLLKLGQLN